MVNLVTINVECSSARLKTSFDPNPVTEGKQWTFPFFNTIYLVYLACLSKKDLYCKVDVDVCDGVSIIKVLHTIATDQSKPYLI